MKKRLMSVFLATVTLFSATGCASNISAPQEENQAIIQESKSEETNVAPESAVTLQQSNELPNDIKTSLEECFLLIGKDDAAAAELLGGGKENIAGDGVTKIGRIYSLKLFGEEIEVGTLYDENNCVYMITIQLGNPDASVYAEQLNKIYGEPDTTDTPSETGATWESWNIGDVQLRLYQGYELSSLEIMKIPEISEEDAFDTDTLFTGWLPRNVKQVQSESEPNELLKQTIIDYYEIPAEYYEQTKYYYNFVDLDGDGSEEIFAVIVGSYTGGTGGNAALWCQEQDGKMQIRQAFTMVNTPIIVTEETKYLILQRSGGGAETETVQLICEDGIYTNVADAQAVENIDEMKGTAIICNNLIKDMENGNFLTLAD